MSKVIYLGNGWQGFENGKIYDAVLDAEMEKGKKSWFVFKEKSPFIFQGRRGYFVYDHQNEFDVISDRLGLCIYDRIKMSIV